jgi:hypothetical protein
MNCDICNSAIDNGAPYLPFKSKVLCYQCYIDIVSRIYKMAGFGDGGLLHIIFKNCLVSSVNRKNRFSLSANKKILVALLHKYKFKCVKCDKKDDLTIDHVVPVSKGGTDEYSNLQILCKACNSKKGARIG